MNHTNCKTDKHRLVYFGGRPVIALPEGSRKMKLAGLACYRSDTVRKILFGWAMRLAVLAGVDALVSQPADEPLKSLLPFDLADWLDTLRNSLDMPAAKAAIVWPNDLARQRVYVYLLNIDGQMIAFTKVSLDDRNDESLQKEAGSLEAIQAMGPRTFSIPSVIQSGIHNGHRYLAFEPIPLTAKPVQARLSSYPSESVKEYASSIRSVSGDELGKFGWWREYRDTINPKLEFSKEVNSYQDKPQLLCRAHGDLGTNNIIRLNGQLLIYDWEESCGNAPQMTDEIAFFLRLNQRKFIAEPLVGLRKLARRYLSSKSGRSRQDVVMALAFLYPKLDVARKLVHSWNQLKHPS